MEERRVYQVWKGSNKFFFSGRLIFGPDVKSLFMTVFLILVPVVIFCIFIAKHLMHKFPTYNSGIAIMVVTLVFTIYVLTLLLLTSSRDPGIIPRNSHPPEPDENDSCLSPGDSGGSHQTPRWRLPRTKDGIIDGKPVKMKYCDTCMLYRPPRCSHCSICNNCVERFDHHCPWVGQCIGQRNYRFFFMFVSSATILCIYVFSISALSIKFVMDGDQKTGNSRTVWQAMAKSPASVVLMAYTFIAVWFVGGLTLFHFYLISTNQTTYENFRYRYDSRESPYNLGFMKNFYSIFCTPIPSSKNDFRAKVRLDQSGHIVSTAIPKEDGNPGEARIEVNENDAHEVQSEDGDLHTDEENDSFNDGARPRVTEQSYAGEVGPRILSQQQRSNQNRKSGNWEMTPEIVAFASGSTEECGETKDDSASNTHERHNEDPQNTGL